MFNAASTAQSARLQQRWLQQLAAVGPASAPLVIGKPTFKCRHEVQIEIVTSPTGVSARWVIGMPVLSKSFLALFRRRIAVGPLRRTGHDVSDTWQGGAAD